MINRKQGILMPGYMKEFHCIGSACEDTCCGDWTVDLDKETYQRYKNNTDEELKPIIDSMIRRKHNNKSDISYGKIVMDKDNLCPFLDGDKLCKIHGKLGEGYLSNTCSSYPRYLNRIDGKLENSITMSCPEAARIALLEPAGINFEQIYEDTTKMQLINNIFDTEGHLFYNKLERYFWDIRIFSLSLLQNRNYKLVDRLIILGMFYKKVEEIKDNKEVHDIPKFVEKYNNMVEANIFKDALKNIDSNIKIQMIITKHLLNLERSKSKKYNECLDEVLIGLQYNEKDIETISTVYQQNYVEYVAPYLNEKEYILENYIVNEYFKELMPFGKFESIWDSYMFLCALYSIVKLHLVGIAGYHEGLTDELTIKVIQSISKVVLHNDMYINVIVKILKANGFDNMAYMAILVKN